MYVPMNDTKTAVYEIIAQAVHTEAEAIVIEEDGLEYRAVPAMVDGRPALRFRVRKGSKKLNFAVDFEPYRDTLDYNFHVFTRKGQRTFFGYPEGIEFNNACLGEAIVFFNNFMARVENPLDK